jgi:hypothetical protein
MFLFEAFACIFHKNKIETILFWIIIWLQQIFLHQTLAIRELGRTTERKKTLKVIGKANLNVNGARLVSLRTPRARLITRPFRKLRPAAVLSIIFSPFQLQVRARRVCGKIERANHNGI